MNSKIHIPNAVFASLEKGKTALSLFRAYVIWMREATEMTADSCIEPKLWQTVMIAVIFMLQESKVNKKLGELCSPFLFDLLCVCCYNACIIFVYLLIGVENTD